MRSGMEPYMVPDEHPCYSISNVYYDTPDYALIRASLEKPAYKEKLRLRSYGVPGSRDRVDCPRLRRIYQTMAACLSTLKQRMIRGNRKPGGFLAHVEQVSGWAFLFLY